MAREVVAPGTAGLAAIRARFGDSVIDDDGALDRLRLAEIVFNDEAARLDLNAITHPLVRDLALARVQDLAARGEPLACYEVPLLIESGLADALRPLVVVVVDLATQIERTTQRDGRHSGASRGADPGADAALREGEARRSRDRQLGLDGRDACASGRRSPGDLPREIPRSIALLQIMTC